MASYVARRLLFLLPLWLGVSIIVFVAMRVMPGDVAAAMFGEGSATEEELAAVRHALNLDLPIHVQYLTWMSKMMSLDFGTSMFSRQPVVEIIASRIPPTVNLAVLATLLSIAIGVPAGVVSAVKRDTAVDYLVRVTSILGLALPSFWLAILLTVFLALAFRWSVPVEYVLPWQSPVVNLQKMIWPALILGYEQAAQIARMARSTMLDVLGEDYMRTAYAKGLRGRTVLTRHALRNTMVPVVTVIGINAALMLGGVVVLEMVFSIPGVGSLLVGSIRRRDYPVVEILLMGTATVIMLVNLLVEATYAWLDPRITRN